MPNSQLPERASLEYLKKLAKDRLQQLRQTDPAAKLAAALHTVAREYGFASWRDLKAEIDGRNAKTVQHFFKACAGGDVATLGELLVTDATLVRASYPKAQHAAWIGLHTAAQQGHLDSVQLLLEHGADPNAREAGDNTYPLHWAAAKGHLEVARALLDAGGDAHGLGDVHELDAIGWATFFRGPDAQQFDVASLLVERGARHHIFSAITVGDLALIRKVVAENPKALDRRMSRFENQLTPIHFAMSRKRYDIVDLLIELGAELEAKDGNGLTALEAAMLRGDREAMRRLQSAGAQQPKLVPTSDFQASMAALAESVKKIVPMIHVPDVARALDWYASIGFKEISRFEDDGVVNFGMVSFGQAELMLNMNGKAGTHDASLWFYTGEVDKIYERLKSRQLEAALAEQTAERSAIEFVEHINDTFYGARQFGIRDLNGYILYFIQ